MINTLEGMPTEQSEQPHQLDLFCAPEKDKTSPPDIRQQKMRTAQGDVQSLRMKTDGGSRKRKRKTQLEPGFPKCCEVCKGTTLRTQFELERHNHGKRHKKNKRIKEALVKLEEQRKSGDTYIVVVPETGKRICTVCNVEIISKCVEQEHVMGRKHQVKVRNAKNGTKEATSVAEIINPNKKLKRSFGRSKRRNERPKGGLERLNKNLGRCEVCNVTYTSLIMKQTHVAGKTHIKLSKRNGRSTKENGHEQNPVSINQNNHMKDIDVRQNVSENLENAKGEPHVERQMSSAVNLESRQRDLEALKRMESEAETFFQKYAALVAVDVHKGQAMYKQYEALYRSYEDAYSVFVKKYCSPHGLPFTGA